MPITPTVRTILMAAAKHPDRIAVLPDRLPVAARRAVAQSMLRAGLLVEVTTRDGQPVWRAANVGQRLTLRVTQAGLDVVGSSTATDRTDQPAPKVTTRSGLQFLAQAVLAAWDDPDPGRPALPQAIDALRATLTTLSCSTSTSPRQPRTDTKRAHVLGLLRRAQGATVGQITDATGWARHTVHGFLAGLKKEGTPVTVLDRVRQVGPGKQGAAGSYTVYRVAEAD